jgi:hypothetical protein
MLDLSSQGGDLVLFLPHLLVFLLHLLLCFGCPSFQLQVNQTFVLFFLESKYGTA